MTTFTIELDDKLAQELKQRAEKSHMTVDEIAAVGLRNFLQSFSEEVSDAEFQAVAKRVIERDAELLQRLAQ